MDGIDRLALLLVASIVSFQLFLPPVIGLANNGDFIKITGHFDLYSPAEDENAWAANKYSFDAGHHWDSGFYSSEVLLTGLAVGFARIFNRATFDIRWIGAIHAFLYLLAFYLALPLFHSLPRWRRIILLAIVILILADVMYVSAMNSFYMDTAALVFLGLSTVLFLRALEWKRMSDRIALVISLGLMLTAKTQHVAAALVLFLLAAVAWRKLGGSRAGLAGIAALAAASVAIVNVGTPWDYASTTCFDAIFLGILPYSSNVHEDLAALGLNDSYRRYIGTHRYQVTDMDNEQFVREFIRRTGHFRLVLFYARRPALAWRLLVESIGEGGHGRPYLGNYDKSTGAPPFRESNHFAVWSGWKRAAFWGRGPLYLVYSWGVLATLCVLGWRTRRDSGAGSVLCIAAFAVALMVVMDLLVSALGDAVDTLRHLFVFNAMLDLALILVLALAMRSARSPLLT